jgi:putative SOS response-associated peptidase YedK
MCYQSRLRSGARLIDDIYGWLDDPQQFNPTDIINAFDYPRTPVVTSDKPQGARFLQWGLIPAWAKDRSFQKNTLNARIETLCEKPSFKDVNYNRCLIIADGFYEWRWLTPDGKRKQKYLITCAEEELYTYAGLWSAWTDIKSGEILHTYTIITTEANKLMRFIHNTKKRMPLILSRENEKLWLEGSVPDDYFINMVPELKADIVT